MTLYFGLKKMKKTKTLIKNLKPDDYDISFKYSCPECRNDHWIFLREAKVKNFKIVCECGSIIVPKRIRTINIEFLSEESKPVVKENSVPLDILDECVKILSGYGYTSEESSQMIKESFELTNSTDIKNLIACSLTHFGDKYV